MVDKKLENVSLELTQLLDGVEFSYNGYSINLGDVNNDEITLLAIDYNGYERRKTYNIYDIGDDLIEQWNDNCFCEDVAQEILNRFISEILDR